MPTKPLPVRDGPPPAVTNGIPHVQLDQTSDPEMYTRLVDTVFADERVTQTPSRASLPGALALTVADVHDVRAEAMIVGREFAHVHADPGTGSLHLRLPEEVAAEVVAKRWGEWHPFALSGSAPGMVMLYAPRTEADLEVIGAIVASSVDYSTLPGA